MQIPSLVTSVPDLHTARILAAAGVPYIAFHQKVKNLEEIKPWLEGPRTGMEMKDPDQSLPATDFLIMPASWYDLFSFSGRTIFWKTGDEHFYLGDVVLEKGTLFTPGDNPAGRRFCHYSDYRGPGEENSDTWLDYEEDFNLFESLFL